MNPIFSLIIPSYNVEAYLHDCINSIIQQSDYLKYTEVIIINDGSKDKTQQIADLYAQEYPFIKVYHQNNGGLSRARNNGLTYANGDYIWFIDADDWISTQSLKTLYDIISLYSPDMVMFNACNVISNNESRNRIKFNNVNRIKTGSEVFLSDNWESCAPFAIYSRNFLLNNSLSFYDGIFHEDNEFTPRALLSANSIIQTNDVLYYVRQTTGSITRTINPKRANDIIVVAQSLNDYILNKVAKKQGLNDLIRIRMSKHIAMCLNSALAQTRKFNVDEIHKFSLNLIQHKELLNHFRNSNNLKYFIEWLFLKAFSNPLTGYKILSMFSK